MESLRAWIEAGVEVTAGAEVVLGREESRHLAAARRVRVGEGLTLLDGTGLVAAGRVLRADPKGTVVQVVGVERRAPWPWRLHLAPALPKGKAMELIVQKATELGATDIHPLVSDHSEVRLDEDRREHKAERWGEIAREAAKQCGNPWLPRLHPVTELGAWLRGPGLPEARYVAALGGGARELSQARTPGEAAAVLLVGPEGDLSAREYDEAARQGFRAVTLGPLILRAETAAVVLMSLWLGDFRREGGGAICPVG